MLRLLPAGRPGRGLAGRPGPGTARRAGLLAVQPDAGPAGERGPAAGDGGRGRDARARAAPELGPVGVRPGRLRHRGRRPGRPARAARVPGGAGALTAASGVTHAMAVGVDPTATPGEIIAIDAAQAAQVVRLRGDQIAPAARQPVRRHHAVRRPGGGGAASPQAGAGSGTLQLTASLGLAAAATTQSGALAAALGPVTVTTVLLDRTGSAYPVSATLLADGHPHVLVGLPRRQGALPAPGGLDHGHVRAAAAHRPGSRLHRARPFAGRLDAAGDLARPD